MDAHTRHIFDKQLDQVLAEMPPLVHQLLDEVPLYVEDYPSNAIIKEMDVRKSGPYQKDRCIAFFKTPEYRCQFLNFQLFLLHIVTGLFIPE